MTERRDPWAVEPLGLSKPEAAAYVGLGVTLFETLVGEGLMPKPKRARGRLVWDREELRLAFKALPEDGAEPAKPRSALDRMTA